MKLLIRPTAMKVGHSNSASQLTHDFIPDGNNAEMIEYRNLSMSDPSDSEAVNASSDEETETSVHL